MEEWQKDLVKNLQNEEFAEAYFNERAKYREELVRPFQETILELRKAICVFAREELGNMNFETDQEVIDYFLEFATD